MVGPHYFCVTEVKSWNSWKSVWWFCNDAQSNISQIGMPILHLFYAKTHFVYDITQMVTFKTVL